MDRSSDKPSLITDVDLLKAVTVETVCGLLAEHEKNCQIKDGVYQVGLSHRYIEHFSSAPEVKELLSVIPFAQELLKTLEIERGATVPQLDQLNELLRKHPFAAASFLLPKREALENIQILYVQEVSIQAVFVSHKDIVYLDNDPPSLLAFLARDLSEALKHADRLTRCEACGGLFLRTDRGPRARFCSSRCSSRVRMRRRNEQKKTEQKGDFLRL